MYIANPIAFGVFIGVLSTIVVESTAIFICALSIYRGKK